MIQKLSAITARWLEKEGAVSEGNRSLYGYAVYSLLFGLMPILIAAVLGMIFGMLREGLLMILPFMLIRKFSGGYHLGSPGRCVLFSSLLIALALSAVKAVLRWGNLSVLTVLVFASTVSLWLFSPVDNEARRLSEKEKLVFRRVTRGMAVGFLTAYLAASAAALPGLAVPMGVGVVIPALLQLPALFPVSGSKDS